MHHARPECACVGHALIRFLKWVSYDDERCRSQRMRTTCRRTTASRRNICQPNVELGESIFVSFVTAVRSYVCHMQYLELETHTIRVNTTPYTRTQIIVCVSLRGGNLGGIHCRMPWRVCDCPNVSICFGAWPLYLLSHSNGIGIGNGNGSSSSRRVDIINIESLPSERMPEHASLRTFSETRNSHSYTRN